MKLSTDQARNVIWTSLKPEAVSAYEACLVHDGGSGLFLFVSDATRSQVDIVVKYVGVAGSKLPLAWTGGTPAIRGELPTSITSGETIPTVIDRPKDKDDVYLLALRVADGSFGAPKTPIRITSWPDPPILPTSPCSKLAADGKCVQCEFALKNDDFEVGNSFTAICPSMRSGQAVAEFRGSVEILGAPNTCGAHVQFDDRNGASPNYVNNCKADTAFKKNLIVDGNGQASATFTVTYCMFSHNRTCQVNGMIDINE